VKISKINSRARIAIGFTITAIIALPGTALAATSTHETIPGESNLGYLFVGEIIVWVGFFAYTFYTSRKTNDLRREIEDLRAQLKAAPPTDN
jgi:CcmD family protein